MLIVLVVVGDDLPTIFYVFSIDATALCWKHQLQKPGMSKI